MDLTRMEEEVQMEMMAPTYPAAVAEYVEDHDRNDAEEHNTYSAELQMEGISNDRDEEERLPEAERNERLQMQLKVSTFMATFFIPLTQKSLLLMCIVYLSY